VNAVGQRSAILQDDLRTNANRTVGIGLCCLQRGKSLWMHICQAPEEKDGIPSDNSKPATPLSDHLFSS
jgi:hypothetical protein